MVSGAVLPEGVDSQASQVLVDSAKEAAKLAAELLTGINPVILVLQRVREATQSVAHRPVSFELVQRGPHDSNFIFNVYCREDEVASIAEKIGSLADIQDMWFRWGQINIFIRPVIVREETSVQENAE